MPETRPISERIDLRYVRAKHWPWNTAGVLSLAAAGAFLLYVLVVTVWAGADPGSGGQSLYSSGPLTSAHAMFGDNCAACHVTDPANPKKSGFRLPVRDEACLACHAQTAATHSTLCPAAFNGPPTPVKGLGEPVAMSANCASCHSEHHGADFPISKVDDKLCTQCHADLNAHRVAPATPNAPDKEAGK